jgi:hypothetical protein
MTPATDELVPRFDGPPEIRDLNWEAPEGQIRLQLLTPLVYHSKLLNRTITVPAKFVTDLASVPRLLWVVIPPMGRYDAAAIIHDWLYQRGTVTRAEADNVFNEAMEVCRVRKSLRLTIWSGVRTGGWVPWGRYRKAAVVEVDAKIGEAAVALVTGKPVDTLLQRTSPPPAPPTTL